MTTPSLFDQNFDEPHPFDVAEQPILDGRYKLVEKIGEGAMGMVFRACQISTGQDVAIKLIKRHGDGGNALLQRFQREAAIIAELRHPHIVRLLDIGKDEEFDLAYIVMEYVHGTTLGHYLHDQPEPARATISLALHIVMQVCRALTEPHSKGIIHRDIKPDNILLGVRSDELLDVKLLDFGVAHVSPHQNSEVASHRLTSTGCIVGTPHYLAPELCHTSQAASMASDLYAVGVLLFELLAGYSPFNGESVVDILFRHAHQDTPHIDFDEEVDAELGESLNMLLGELLHKTPEHRPASALDVSQRILDLITTHGIAPPKCDHTSPVQSLLSHFEPSTQSEAAMAQETNLSPVPKMAYVETLEKGIAPQQLQGMTLKGTGEPKDHDSGEVPEGTPSEEAYAGLAASLHALPPVVDPEHDAPLRTEHNNDRTQEFLIYDFETDQELPISKIFLESMTRRLPMVASAAAFVLLMVTGAVMLSTGTIKEAESAPTPAHTHTVASSPVALLEDTTSRSVESLVSAIPKERVAMNEAPEVEKNVSKQPPVPEPIDTPKPAKKLGKAPSTPASPKAAPKEKRNHVRWLYSN